MKVKKIPAILLAVILSCSCASVPASAREATQAVQYEIELLYQYALSANSYLTLTSNSAECVSKCTGVANVKSITIDHTIQKFWGLWIWNNVDGANWSKTTKATSASLVSNFKGLETGTYRLKSEFTVTTTDGKTETFTVYSSESTVS